MSGHPEAPQPPVGSEGAATTPAADPSMEDILASIRRILNEDETPAAPPGRRDDVLVLDGSMMISDPDRRGAADAPSVPAPPATRDEEARAPERLVAPEAAAAAAAAVGSLVKRLASERGALVSRHGPTIEELVREELRPLLKAWLDANLPGLVERLVRVEIERVLGRAAS